MSRAPKNGYTNWIWRVTLLAGALATGRTVFAARADNEAPLATAGRITNTVTSARQIQFSLRLSF